MPRAYPVRRISMPRRGSRLPGDGFGHSSGVATDRNTGGPSGERHGVEMERAATQESGRGTSGPDAAPATGAQRAPGHGPDAPVDRLRLRHPAELGELRAIRRRVERWAGEHGLTDGELIDLQLAIGEAVSNGIEHGYRECVTGPVEVELELRPDGPRRLLSVRVVDHGRWRPAPARPGYRGRGLAMIRSLSEDMRVTSVANGTEVAFTVVLSG
jgi:anti-sigma regulatory factor (Ser/Thr protein kinase)